MKKIMMSAALVAMAMVGCTNEEVVKNSESQMFTLEVGKGMESRTHLNGNQLVWSAGDEIFVTSPDGEVSGVLRLISGENTPQGVFRGEVNGNPKNLKNIVYPVQLGEMKLAGANAQKLVAPMTGTIGEVNTLNLNCGLAKMNVLGLENGNKVKISANGIGSTLRYDLQTNKWIPTGTSIDDITIHNAEDATDFIVPVYTENTNPEETTELNVSVIDNSNVEGGSTPVEVAIVKEQVNESTPILAVTDNGKVINPETATEEELGDNYVYVGPETNLKSEVENASDGAYIVIEGTHSVTQVNIQNKSLTIVGKDSDAKIKDTLKEGTPKTFLIWGAKNEENEIVVKFKNLIFEDVESYDNADVYIRQHNTQNEQDFIKVYFENVICNGFQTDNNYGKRTIMEIKAVNCEMKKVCLEASSNNITDFEYKNCIKMGIYLPIDEVLENIYINGENPEYVGEKDEYGYWIQRK